MSIALILEMASSGFGDRIALGSTDGGITFAELAARAQAGAQFITADQTQHVVFIGRNGPVFPLLLFSAALAGVPFVPLNYRLTRDAVLDLLDGIEKPMLVIEPEYVPLVSGTYQTVSVAEFLSASSPGERFEGAEVLDDSPAVLLFTSGTTARPKTVVLRHANLLAYVFSTADFGSAEVNDATLVAVPPYHIAAVGSALSNAYVGRRVVYLPDFDAPLWLDIVRRERVTSAMVVPTMLVRIVDALGDDPADVPDLRLISYGGARMPRPALMKALRSFPTAGFCNAYGLTETSSTLTLLGPEDHRTALESADPRHRERLGSAGRPVPGVEIQVRDEDGAVAPAGVAGDLYVRGAQVSGEYLGQGSALDADGWFNTRDRARLDDDGYLYVEGRADDTIIRAGENIAPAEIEDVLREHRAVKDVAIVGKPDEEWGERIVAVVVREPDAKVTADELRAYARERLRGSRTPDEVVWRGELPHTATGKLLRRELAAELLDGT
ncbi:MAG TPA: AMP-binding protein [Streptosporangiaceae bacterium]|jgi:acyl-CoA synthetase (AMP-forming)/AMP-acid ligase II|nr:AMP-binding protein [Streptosporangiaceae bacterium]